MSAQAAHTELNLLGRFGLTEFRPGQRQVIAAILEGHDCLCIMPTGGGKSLCFQYPAIAREGLVVVISPLIALMKDQVDALCRQGIKATYINSSLSYAEQQKRSRGMITGEYDLVYVAPERLRNPAFFQQLTRCSIQLLAVDEAHCISQWGHDVRPDYAKIGRFRARLGQVQTIALTATATPSVRDDIVNVLRLRQPHIFVAGFARDNLKLSIRETQTEAQKDERLIAFLEANPGCGIIYAATRKNCEHIDQLLRRKTHRTVSYYHAGLESSERREIQERFISGETEIIVATNAFGMGIDKANVRFVIHYNLPGSIEAYYQEAGRAGRDGLPSSCLLLHSYRDRFIQEYFIENNYPDPKTVRTVYEYLRSIPTDPIELTLQEIVEDLELSVSLEGIRVCENLLEKSGALERLSASQNMASVRLVSDLPTLVDLLPREAKTKRKVMRAIEKRIGDLRGERLYFHLADLAKEVDMRTENLSRTLRSLNELKAFDYVPPFRGRAVHVYDRRRNFADLKIDFSELNKRKRAEYDRLHKIIDLAKTQQCRQQAILDYFGDPESRECNQCDNCRHQLGQVTKEFSPREAGCLYAVQVILSGVVRSRSRCGKTLLAQMLSGSQAKKLRSLGLDRLSTFGLLRDLQQNEVAAIIDALIAARLLTQDEIQKFRPVIKLTSMGRQVMMGELFPDFSEVLGRSVRERLNFIYRREQPKLSIDTDRHELPLERAPAERSFDPEDMETGARAATEQGDPEPPLDVAAAADAQSSYWTWHLFTQGYDMRQVCEIRRMDESSVIGDLLESLESGWKVDLKWVLSHEQMVQLDAAQSEAGNVDSGMSAISPEVMWLIRKCRANRPVDSSSPPAAG